MSPGPGLKHPVQLLEMNVVSLISPLHSASSMRISLSLSAVKTVATKSLSYSAVGLASLQVPSVAVSYLPFPHPLPFSIQKQILVQAFFKMKSQSFLQSVHNV